MMPAMRSKVSALLECAALFGLAVLVFSGLHAVETVRALDAQLGGRQFVEYAALALLTPLLLLLFRRDFAQYGLRARPLRYQLRIFTAAFLPVFLLSAALSWIPWKTWPGTLLVCILAAALLVLTVWMLRRQPEIAGMIPIAALLPLLLAPVVPGRAANPLINLVYFYLLVGPSEEMLFRGAIQSRLNLAFGRPNSTAGIRWGWGLPAAALLFGAWHVALNPGALAQAVWTTFAGLIFGVVREKSGGSLAPALLHGVLNYGPQAFLFDLFFR